MTEERGQKAEKYLSSDICSLSSANGWHVDKRVSIGHIVATLAVAVGALVWFTDLDKRTALNTEAVAQIRLDMQRMEERNLRALDEIRATLVRIENKLETKEDKGQR
jgi:hypothetical protein